MARDPRFDILFEPVRIGPVTTKNRFYQVPQCNGMGHRFPQAMAKMRGIKAEGGWGVVCTEEAEIHPSSDLSPGSLMRLWDDSDLPTHQRMTDAVHEHGGLAGIELVHNGANVGNYFSRMAPLAPSNMATLSRHPFQARAMDKQDIRDLRRWHRDAALRAKRAGYDLIYTYAGHNMTVLMHFMLPRYNQRMDEYGGSLENRVRLTREILEETKDAVGDTCAVPFRFAVDELMGVDGMRWDVEGREIVEMLADIPDLWDVNVAGWANDTLPSRFGREGAQEDYMRFVKQVTNKPVVGVGRFTSPDTMVSQIKHGVLDLIGAARPSIADPFLPNKIRDGKQDEIRECIGCNICVMGDYMATPIRCTQNPTMGEEYRKGWHPEVISPKETDSSVLIIGSGPAGLEAALALGKRGYDVTLAERGPELGGRVLHEAKMPGLSVWKRVVDHRVHMISQMANVNTYVNSPLQALDVFDFNADHIVCATGAKWRGDGVGRSIITPLVETEETRLFSPDFILGGGQIDGKIVIYDDDHYYIASVIALHLAQGGCDVTYVTPSDKVSEWSELTMEQARTQKQLMENGVNLVLAHELTKIGTGFVVLTCAYTGKIKKIPANAVIPVTTRTPREGLFNEIMGSLVKFGDLGLISITKIGDCFAPGTIAMAVYSGHDYAQRLEQGLEQGLDGPARQDVPFLRENYQPSSSDL